MIEFAGASKHLDVRPEGRSSLRMTIQLVCVSFLFCALLVSCATSSTSREYNRPWGVVRATVQKNLPLGVRTTSRNGRTFESNYFVPKGSWEDDGTDARERAFARVTILNSSRPYQVEASVYRQSKISGGYSDPELDDTLSERLSNKIATDIANRREDRNIIDDFKPF